MKGRNSATSRPIPAPPNRPKQHALREQKYVSPLVNGLVAMVETSFTPPVSPLHKKSPVDNTNEEAQEALDTIQRLSKEATLRDTGKFFHHMHSTLEHAILYRKGKGQFNVYFKDVVKGIEMKLNGEIGKIKSKCLEVEERNKQLVGKAASHKIKNLTNIVEMQRTKENIRSMRVACDRALSRTNLAHKQIDKIRVKALQSEETSHELRTRAEGIQFQISATKTDIYATNDKTADRIRARDRMYTHQEFREAKELRKDLGAKLETIKVEYAEVLEDFIKDAAKFSTLDKKFVASYEKQENSTVDLYLDRDTHTPTPEFIGERSELLETICDQSKDLESKLEKLVNEASIASAKEIANSGPYSKIMRNAYLVLQDNFVKMKKNNEQLVLEDSGNDRPSTNSNPPGFTSAVVNGLSMIVQNKKLLELGREALDSYKAINDSNETYKKEKVLMDKLSEKLMSDKERAKKYGGLSIKVLKCEDAQRRNVLVGKILGSVALPEYLQVMDLQITKTVDQMTEDDLAVHDMYEDMERRLSKRPKKRRSGAAKLKASSRLARIAPYSLNKLLQTIDELWAKKDQVESVLQMPVKLQAVVEFHFASKAKETLPDDITKYFKQKEIVRKRIEAERQRRLKMKRMKELRRLKKMTGHESGEEMAEEVAEEVDVDADLDHQSTEESKKRIRRTGSKSFSLFYACFQNMHDVRVVTFLYVLNVQVTQHVREDLQKIKLKYRRHLRKIELLEGHNNQGIVWRKNIIASLPRFFLNISEKEVKKLEAKLEKQFPFSFVDPDALMTVREPFSETFLHDLLMLALKAHRKYYFKFRSKLSIADPTGSGKVAVPLIAVALSRADHMLKDDRINEMVAAILGTTVENLKEEMFHPPGQSPTKFIPAKSIADAVLQLRFFPTRFCERDSAAGKPKIVLKYREPNVEQPLSEQKSIKVMFRKAIVYNDGKIKHVLMVDPKTRRVHGQTLNKIRGYTGWQDRTPRHNRHRTGEPLWEEPEDDLLGYDFGSIENMI